MIERIRADNEPTLELYRSEQFVEILPETKPVDRGALELACNGVYGAASTFSEWTFSEPDAAAREVFAVLADRKQFHLERLGSRIPGQFEATAGGPVHNYLRECRETPARVGAGLLGRTLLEQCAYECFLSEMSLRDPTRTALELVYHDTETTLEEASDLVAGRPQDERTVIRDHCDHVIDTGRQAVESVLSS